MDGLASYPLPLRTHGWIAEQLGWQQVVQFFVPGRPQQRGSKIPVHKKGGGVLMKNGNVILRDQNKNSEAWMGQVKSAAFSAWGKDLIQGPVALSVEFYFARLKGHFRTGKHAGELRDTAPFYHTSTPDMDKLMRSVGDSLSGIIIGDDKQICEFLPPFRKVYTTASEGALITVFVPAIDNSEADG